MCVCVCVCVCVSHVCPGCIMQCDILLLITTFYLHNKLLLCRANGTLY